MAGEITEVPGRPAILIVDDDPKVRRFLELTLARQGWPTLAASSGAAAVALAGHYDGPIPLAIVDLVMPAFGGLDFANQLRIDRPATQVLYISGSAGSVQLDSLSREAPRHVLQKPFTAAELLDRINALLAR